MLNINKIDNFAKKSLISTFSKTIVEKMTKKRSVFEQFHLNPLHISKWKTVKRLPQEKFYDPNYVYPPKMPSACSLSGKALLHKLDMEQKEIIRNKPEFKRVDLGLGDVIDVDYYHSISSGKIYTYRGVVIGRSRPNSLTYSFRFLTSVAGFTTYLDYPFYSPMIAAIRIVNKGPYKHKRQVFNVRKVKFYGYKINEIMKGGKKVQLTKKERKVLKIEESKNDDMQFNQ